MVQYSGKIYRQSIALIWRSPSHLGEGREGGDLFLPVLEDVSVHEENVCQITPSINTQKIVILSATK